MVWGKNLVISVYKLKSLASFPHMTITSIEEIGAQAYLSDNMRTALNFLGSVENPLDIEIGKIEIDGDEVYGFSQSYDTKPVEDALYEAHREYIDIQVMIGGSEIMGWLPLDQLEVTEQYNAEGDFLLGKPSNKTTHVAFEAGQAMVMLPSDAHAPGVSLNGSAQPVRKIVLKVKIG